MKKSKYLFYACWGFLACIALVELYNIYIIPPVNKKITKTAQIDTLVYVYHNLLVPMGDSAEYHFKMAQRYVYLKDTAGAKREIAQAMIWDKRSDTVIQKYHFKELMSEYKYPVNQL